MEVLVILSLVALALLFLVTIIGHGVWLAVAWLLRMLLGRPAPGRTDHARQPAGEEPAEVSAAGLHPLDRVDHDRAAARRHLRRLFQSGAISQQEFERLSMLVDRHPLEIPVSLEPGGEVVLAEAVGVPEDSSAFPPPATAPSPPPSGSPFRQAQPVLGEQQAPGPRARLSTTQPHPLDIDYPATEPVTGGRGKSGPVTSGRSKSGRALAAVLRAFMEERNIRWGELISGMLIISSAVGLVISLRHTLEVIPYFEALLFMLFTAAVHLAGNYTLHRWKLASTSRGVLIIGTLLIPLSVLAAIQLSGSDPVSGSGMGRRDVLDPIYLAAVGVGLVSFSAMAWFAARALLPGGWWSLVLVVMGPSAAQLLIHRLADGAAGLVAINALAALPLGCFLVGVLDPTLRAARRKQFGRAAAERLLLLLGLAGFSLATAWLLLVLKSSSWLLAARDLSPSLSLAATAFVAVGLLLQLRCLARSLAPLRVTGAAIWMTGCLVMVGSVLLAWPQPERLMAVGSFTAVALAVLGWRTRVPALYVPASVSFALAYALLLPWLSGTTPPTSSPTPGAALLDVLVSGTSSLGLLLPAAVIAVAAWGLRRMGRADDALQVGIGSVVIAGFSLLLALYCGFLQPTAPGAGWTTLVLALIAGTGLAAGYRAHVVWLAAAASALVLAALVQGLLFNATLTGLLEERNCLPRHPWLFALLTHALLTIGPALMAWLRTTRQISNDSPGNAASDTGWSAVGGSATADENTDPSRAAMAPSQAIRAGYCEPLALAAGATSLLVAVAAVLVLPSDLNGVAWYLCGATVVWSGLSCIRSSPVVWSTMQVLATGALVAGVAQASQSWGWWDGRAWWAPRHLLAQVGVLSAWSGIWILATHFFRRPWLERRLPRRRYRCEQVVLMVAVAGLLGVAALGCLPGVLVEWGARPASYSESSGFSLHAATYWQAWATLILVAGVAAFAVWDQPLLERLALGPMCGFVLVALLSTRMEPFLATATGLRWGVGLYALIAAVMLGWPARTIGVIGRGRLEGAVQALTVELGQLCRPTVLLSGAVVLLLTSVAAVRAVQGLPPAGPLSGSWLGQVSPLLLSAPPLVLVQASLLLLAVRFRRSEYMVLGAVVFQYAVSLAYLLSLIASGATEPNWGAGLAQWNAVGLVIYAVLWQLVSSWTDEVRSTVPWRQMHLTVASVGVVATVACGVAAVVATPAAPPPWVDILGAWPSYLAVLLGLAGVSWELYGRQRSRQDFPSHSRGHSGRESQTGMSAAGITLIEPLLLSGPVWAAGLVLLASLAGISLNQWDAGGRWLSYHALMAGWAGSGLFLAVVSFLVPVRWLPAAAGLLAVLVVGLAVRGTGVDPQAPWWSVAMTVAASGTLALVCVRLRRQALAYVSTVLLVVACVLLWWDAWAMLRLWSLPGVVSLSLTATTLAAIGWLLVELVCQRRFGESLDPDFPGPAVHQSVGALATILVTAGIVGGLLVETVVELFRGNSSVNVSGLGNAVTIVLLLVLWSISLWDRRGRLAVPGLYLLGAISVGFGLDLGRDLTSLDLPSFVVLAGLAAAVYVAATGHAWRFGANLAALGMRMGIPDPVRSLRGCAGWLPVATLIWTAMVVWIEFSIVLTFEARWMRMTAALAPIPLAYAAVCLAQPPRRDWMRTLALLLLGLSCVFLSWADLSPAWDTTAWLVRAVRLLVALCIVSFAYGPLAFRLLPTRGPWFTLMQRTAAGFAAAALGLLVLVLGLELVAFEPGVGSGLDGGHATVVAVMLAGLIAGLLSLAVWPQHDPLALNERGRMAYVYTGQLVAVLLLAHLYLAQPGWFGGLLRPYWPYLLLGLALAGEGIGELCRRRGLLVLAEPLQRTGMFLPVIPAMGMWFVASQGPPGVGAAYTLVLFLAGLFYAAIGIFRKSVWASAAAALAGNGALWSLLTTGQFHLFEHPQMWLIPPALCVLAAVHVYRQQLTAGQLASARYVCVLIIYLSSVGEMLLAGIGRSPWPPMILASLSVAGVLVGIALRVRAFMYTGTVFLGLAIIAMVGHAYARLDHVGIWWAFGIVLGVLILILFGVFEKSRPRLIQWIDQLQQWDR